MRPPEELEQIQEGRSFVLKFAVHETAKRGRTIDAFCDDTVQRGSQLNKHNDGGSDVIKEFHYLLLI